MKRLLTSEEIKFVVDLKLYEKDEIFIIEVMDKFKSMGRVDNIETIMLNFTSTIQSYVKTKLKKECKYVELSPMRETFKLLVSNVDNLGVYFGVEEVPYIEKLIVDKY